MKRIIDFSAFEHLLPASSGEYAVFQPLSGWRSQRMAGPLAAGFHDDLLAVSGALDLDTPRDRWEVARLEAVRSFRDPLDYVDPFGDIDRGSLSPIGIVHLFRRDEYELDRVLGASIGQVSVAPSSSLDLIDDEGHAFEADDEDLGVASAGMRRQWVVPRSGAAPSLDLVALRVAARAHIHRWTRRHAGPSASGAGARRPRLRPAVDGVDATTRVLLRNPGRRMTTYDLRQVMRRVGVQLQDVGAALCWQVVVVSDGEAPFRDIVDDLLRTGIPNPSETSGDAVATLLHALFDIERLHSQPETRAGDADDAPARRRVLLPIRHGQEHNALAWLQRLHIEGADGLDETYEATAYERALLGRPHAPMSVRDALSRFADLVQSWNGELMVDGEVSGAPGSRGFRHLADGFRPQPSGAPTEVFDQWVDVRPTASVVPVEVLFSLSDMDDLDDDAPVRSLNLASGA